MSVLLKILEDKRVELAGLKTGKKLKQIKELAENTRPPKSLSRILAGNGIKLIAEVKKASPSRGLLSTHFDAVALAKIYANNGASAISVITEKNYFQGDISYLKQIKTALGDGCPPLLRKDFIIDPYQVYETRAAGADCLLLIAAALTKDELTSLLELSNRLGLECLVEIHNFKELHTAIDCGASIIGINNRNLDTFEVDLGTTRRLRPLIPDNCIVVSESGFNNRQDVLGIKDLDINAILVGSALVTSTDIALKMRELLL